MMRSSRPSSCQALRSCALRERAGVLLDLLLRLAATAPAFFWI